MPYKKITPPPSTVPVSPFLDANGAAAFLRMSVTFLAKLRTRGQGPVFSKLGGKVLYHIDDLLAWVAAHRAQNTVQVEYHGRPRGRPKKIRAEPPEPIIPRRQPVEFKL
jgi:hypothetical protein